MTNKKTTTKLFFITISIYLAAFLLDVAQLFDFTISGFNLVRDILAIFGSVFLLITFIQWSLDISTYDKIKYIFYSILFIFAINYFYPFYVNQAGQKNTGVIFSLSSLVSLILLMFVLALIRELIFVQRKRGTNRNFNLLFSLFIFYSYFSQSKNFTLDFKIQPSLNINLPDWANIVYMVLTIVMVYLIVINSFRTQWVKFLNKNEKIKTLFLNVFVLTLLILLIIKGETIVSEYSLIVGNLFSICTIFLTIYFSFSILVILLHLPTAGVYDRKVRELSSLHDLSRHILGVFDINKVIQIITDQTISVAEANYSWLVIKNLSSKHFELVAYKNLPATLIETYSDNPTNELTEWVATNKSALKIDRISKHDLTSGSNVWRHRSGSLLGIPLISNDEVMGILFAVKSDEYGFLPGDEALLTMFANNATVAIENANLVKRSLDQEKYEQELKIAHEAQRKLLPHTMPEIKFLQIDAACKTANEVGGDYYDFFLYDNSKLGIIIGDVSGKGAEAAFYMAEVKGVFESLGSTSTSPKELLINTNKILYNTLDSKTFVSALFGTFDFKKHTFTFCRAGHCPLLYWSANENEVYLVEPAGLALGLDGGMNFNSILKEEKIKFHSNDIFVFITDGINEARNAHNEEFEEQRICDIVFENQKENATAIKNVILEKIENFVGDQKQHDDLTMVVIKVV
ncbi:SpoIIE family protein phosphatase [candidate division KSB1 bacterium]|nr:SpoIIE family protein phosphatase [candidate division KSB1 bacterium]